MVKIITLSLTELFEDYFNLGQFWSEIAAAAIVLVLSVIVGWAIYLIFRRYFSRWAKRTKTKIDDEILRSIKAPVLLLATLIGAFHALNLLSFLSPYSRILEVIFTIAGILVVTFTITRIVNVLANWLVEGAEREKRVSKHILFLLKKTIQAIVYVFAFLAILVALRIDLSGVIVGLGVGGIAVALALQNVLTDVFSAFSIYFDRPFEVGDFIVVGDYAGTVKQIGIKSTRLQLLQGEELIISNRELTTASLRNFKKLKKRRALFKLSVAADTPVEKLRKIPGLVQKIIESTELAQFDRAHFTEFGSFTLDFQVVYYMETPDYNQYLDAQQKINLGIIEAFEKEGIIMPFPTHTILVRKPRQS